MSFEPLVDRLLVRTVGRDRETMGQFLALSGALGVGLFVSIETFGVPLRSGWIMAGFELLPVALLSFSLAAYSAYVNGGALTSVALVAVPAFAIGVQSNPYFMANITPPPNSAERFAELVRQSVRLTLLAVGWLGLPAFLLGTLIRYLRERRFTED